MLAHHTAFYQLFQNTFSTMFAFIFKPREALMETKYSNDDFRKLHRKARGSPVLTQT